MIDGGAGNDTIDGGYGNDTLFGGSGNDVLAGADGADTYIFNLGDGQDIINNYDPANWMNDRLVFGEGINPEDMEIKRQGYNLVISNKTNEDQIIIQNALSNGYGYNYLQTIEFADGTKWDSTYIRDKIRYITGTEGDDVINGIEGGYNYSNSEVIDGGVGNDIISAGYGDDIVIGGIGNDYLYGSVGNDRLEGGSGNDYMHGDVGDDTFYFEKGFGQDIVCDSAGSNKISFGEDIYVEDLWVEANGTNLELNIGTDGDQICLSDFYKSACNQNFLYEFSDGTTLDNNDITSIMNGTYVYETTYKQAALFADMLASVSDEEMVCESEIYTGEQTGTADTSQLWVEA